MRLWLLSVLTVLLVPQASRACSCDWELREDDRAAVAEALVQSDVVFAGRVEAVEVLSTEKSKIEGQRTLFYVLQSWKGETSSRMYIETTLASCGFAFPETGEYLIYAYRSAETGSLRTSVCSRTKPVADASWEISVLDELYANGTGRTNRWSRRR